MYSTCLVLLHYFRETIQFTIIILHVHVHVYNKVQYTCSTVHIHIPARYYMDYGSETTVVIKQ